MPMKLFLMTMMIFAACYAQANDVTDMQDQKVVLLNIPTITAIQQTIDNSALTLDQKTAAIKKALQADATAKDGFCTTGVKTWGKTNERPKADKVAEACALAFEDDDFINGIASGEIMSQPQADPDMRITLSRAYSGYILLMALGPF